ncbi:MAG: hypothetical protein Q4G46_13445, partial [Propionibacteriaceae bacterium]|nr:hypothetical protein [Propionibacteriaceae bacterium]
MSTAHHGVLMVGNAAGSSFSRSSAKVDSGTNGFTDATGATMRLDAAGAVPLPVEDQATLVAKPESAANWKDRTAPPASAERDDSSP